MNSGTLLYRQVNPSWTQQNRITSQVFKPTPKDKNRLSVYDGDQIAAEDSWKHYTGNLGLVSVGVMAVTVRECDQLDLPTAPDPNPFPQHVVIKFDNCSKSQVENKAKRLKIAAEARGWQFQAVTE